jgi:hypothetical protein
MVGRIAVLVVKPHLKHNSELESVVLRFTLGFFDSRRREFANECGLMIGRDRLGHR